MPEITTETVVDEANAVVMQFRTQGGAVVELHRQDRTLRTQYGASSVLLADGGTRLSHGFNWRCLGCYATGGRGRYGSGNRHFDEFHPEDSRDEANQHAGSCWSMPKAS